MLWSRRPALLLRGSPGKVTSVTLVTGRPGGGRGGEGLLQYARDHDRTFISALMPGGEAARAAAPLLTLFMRFLTFPALRRGEPARCGAGGRSDGKFVPVGFS